MSKIPPDSSDIIVWSLTETSSVYRNTGSFLPNDSTTDLSVVNSVFRTGNGPFQENCLYLPGTENFPTGSSSTRNSVRGANTVNPTPPFTVSAWVWLRSYTGSNFQNLISKAYRDPTITSAWSNPWHAISISTTTSNGGQNWEISVATNATTRVVQTISDFPIPLFQWNHIGIVHDGTTIKAYLNGCQCIYYSGGTQLSSTASSTVSYTDGTNGFGPWTFGAIVATGSANKEEPNYMIQDVRVANVARPLSYFKDTYKVGVLPINLVQATQYYKLRAYDSSCVTPTAVTWVDTSISLENAPAFPCSGPYINLEVLDTWIL